MKTLEEVESIIDQFIQEYSSAMMSVNNQMAVGIGKDSETGQYTIEVRLTNNKLEDVLPYSYQNIKVNIKIIGKVHVL